MNKAEFYFKEGCFIEEWLNTELEPNMSIARVRVEAGQSTKNHKLVATEERYVVLSGKALVEVDGKTWSVGPKDVVTIKPGIPQRIHNKGEDDLVFLAICVPRFEVTNYLELPNSV